MSGFKQQRPPDGQVRRSQLLLGAGPGALVDLVEDAAIVGGLDAWRYRRSHDGFIPEARLQAKAQALLSQMEWWPHSEVRLRLPPECDSQDASPGVGVPVARFPRWNQCQNPECRSLVPLKGLERPAQRRHRCQFTSNKSYPVVPIRFVSACVAGHVQDIDWPWFVHRDRGGEEQGGRKQWCNLVPGANRDALGGEWTAELALVQIGTSGDLSDFIVRCRKCGRQRGLQDLAQEGVLGTCQGHRPWLGYSAKELCAEPARLLTRTATNAYFTNAISVLSIRDPAVALREAVEKVWDFVRVATLETLPTFRMLPNVQAVLGEYTDADVVTELERRRLGLPVPTPPIRETEWRALMAAPYESPTEHPNPDERWFARRMAGTFPSFLDRIVLVQHLTEVRAQVGFTRIDAVAGDAEGEYTLDVRTAPLAQFADWVPAVEILGEGVFLAFNGEILDRWAAGPGVQERRKKFVSGMVMMNAKRAKPSLIPFPGERLVLLHTLAHLLINSISLECGYAATSIRERLYCATEGHGADEKTVRAGILLYTGSPGSEGTLGGLVEVGRNVIHHLRKAAEMAMLCSNDPVCAQHTPDDDQEGRHREGAACHGCVLIGEPSCERMNQDLDRALVVPTVETGDAAFLKEWIASWT
jgi:hypothetical protein